MQHIRFPHAGEMLTGTLFLPQGAPPFPGIIFFHGMTSSEKSYLPYAQALAERGIAGLTLNIRGHGESDGSLDELTCADLETDGLVAYDFFAAQPDVDPARIGICGGSFGGLLAATVSRERAVKSLVLRAPAAYTSAMRREKIPAILQREGRAFRDAMAEIDRAPAIAAIAAFGGSLLVVACELDSIIPLAICRAYYDAAASASRRRFEILEGTEHSLQNDEVKQRFNDCLVDWFLKTL